ncbi:MAG: putative motility protein [Aminobacteriaceae bacterium]
MNVGMVQNVMATEQSDAMAQVGLLVQKKAMDVAKLQGQMLQEMMASMGIGQNLDIQA